MCREFNLAIFLIAFISFGCARFYLPAIYRSSSSPIIFEPVDSLNKFSEYLSADVTSSSGYNENEVVNLVRGSYNLVQTGDYFSSNARIFGYGGYYKVFGLGKYDGNKSVFGLGVEFGGCANLKLSSLKIGLGSNLGVFGEFGEYYNFQKKAGEEGVIAKGVNLINYTISAFLIIAYEFSKNSILSTQINLGIPGLITPIIVLNKDKYGFWLSLTPDINNSKFVWDRIVFGFMFNLDKF